MECEERGYQYLADVRCQNEFGKNKLLFRLAYGDDGISIVIKVKGNNQMSIIPIYVLLEPFSKEPEHIRKYCKMLGCDLNFNNEK